MQKRVINLSAFGSRTKKSINQGSKILRSIGNERRLMIVCYLIEKERHVGELEKLIGISQSALSQHLARLRLDGLVRTRRDAQCVFYSLAKDKEEMISDIVSILRGTYEKRVAAA